MSARRETSLKPEASPQPETPFDSLEGAREYIQLLLEALADAKKDLAADTTRAELSAGARAPANGDRRLQALRLVNYKLDKLDSHLQASSRLLNDLRTLRRLLLEERIWTSVNRTGTEG